ncbi:DUF3426 domain-containing protein [Rhodospira trueperi]|uniref:DUF3426 domain-containing protein n=1 Tax=Rhodospira trueperi TaxID=69960 RepID=A0A1G7B152_9PROT|nr:Protein of unknown function [Rhodospira trueperi]
MPSDGAEGSATRPEASSVAEQRGDHGPLAAHLETPSAPAPADPVGDGAADDLPPDPVAESPRSFPDEPPAGRGRTMLDDVPLTREPGSDRDQPHTNDDDGPDFDDILARLEDQERERSGRAGHVGDDDDVFDGDDDDLTAGLGGGSRKGRSRGGRSGGRSGGRLAPPWASWTLGAVVVVLGLLGALYFLRDSIVGWVPESEGVYNALGVSLNRPGLGLQLENVVPTRELVDDEEILVVRGIVANVSDRVRPVPGINLTLNNSEGEMVQRTVAPPPTDTLEPGTTIPFRITMRNRLPEAVAIEVTFSDRPAEPIMAPPQ